MTDDIVERHSWTVVANTDPDSVGHAIIESDAPDARRIAYVHAGEDYATLIARAPDMQAEITSLRADVAELATMLQRTTGYLAFHADEAGPTDCPSCADMLDQVDAVLAKHREG